MAFGLPMGFLDKGEDSQEAETLSGKIYRVPGTIEALHQGVRFSVTLAQLGSHEAAQWFKCFIQRIPTLSRTFGLIGGVDFHNICIHQLRKRIENGPPARTSSDFIGFVLNENDGQEGHSEVQIGKIMADSNMMMNAGSDTTAAALSSTIYHLISNPACLAKLRNEVEACFPFHGEEDAEEGLLPYSSVCELPYLRACIDETLRLRPPIAYQLPRLVHSPEGATIAGHHVRQGTVVAVPTFSVHRHKDLYKDPDEFMPERWLDTADAEQIKNLKTYTIPFSQGSRACIGRHIAIVELQILVSSLVRRYDMELSYPGKQLETFERFNSNPGPLPIHIRPRQF